MDLGGHIHIPSPKENPGDGNVTVRIITRKEVNEIRFITPRIIREVFEKLTRLPELNLKDGEFQSLLLVRKGNTEGGMVAAYM